MSDDVKQLPDDLPGLIRLAIEDLGRCEADERYEINMHTWHLPSPSGEVCQVCLAGSVMAGSLSVDASLEQNPSEVASVLGQPKVSGKLRALDACRANQLEQALRLMGCYDDVRYLIMHRAHEAASRVPDYDSGDPRPFKDAMLELADKIQEAVDEHAAR